MKTIFLISSLTILSWHSGAQFIGEWAWMHGPQTQQAEHFGTQGVPSPQNLPPEDYEAFQWTDQQGNFWMSGGLWGYSDMWKFDVALNQWIWMKGTSQMGSPATFGSLGVADPSNDPGMAGYGGYSWTDLHGDFWRFGGSGGGYSNALWKFKPDSLWWTWMNGDSAMNNIGNYGVQGVPSIFNSPPGREEATSAWTDNDGNLWCFGGIRNLEFKNDLWKYDIATNEWTWMKGDSGINLLPVYGTKGVSNPSNDPGGRAAYSHWKDNAGNLWFFGGGTFWGDEFRNDMWKYDPGINEWTWMNGTTFINDSFGFVVGMYCSGNIQNYPGSRIENKACWTDACGKFWMYGGACETTPEASLKGDLWRFDPDSNTWSQVSGNYTTNDLPVYGSIGVNSPFNHPGGRMGSCSWMDNTGNLWLGFGIVPWNTFTYWSNNLWRYTPDCGCITLPVSSFNSATEICSGDCINFSNTSQYSTSCQWIFPGADPDSSSDINPSNICYANTGTYDVILISSNTNGSDTLILQNYISVFATVTQSVNQIDDTLFAIAGAASYQWFFNGNVINGATDYFYVATANGNYSVVATDVHGCESEAVINNVITKSLLATGYLPLEVYPNPVSNKLLVNSYSLLGTADAEISILNVLGEKVFTSVYSINGNDESLIVNCENLSNGIYSLQIITGEKIFRTKFLKQ